MLPSTHMFVRVCLCSRYWQVRSVISYTKLKAAVFCLLPQPTCLQVLCLCSRYWQVRLLCCLLYQNVGSWAVCFVCCPLCRNVYRWYVLLAEREWTWRNQSWQYYPQHQDLCPRQFYWSWTFSSWTSSNLQFQGFHQHQCFCQLPLVPFFAFRLTHSWFIAITKKIIKKTHRSMLWL